jgi:hypothetical protein
VQFAECGLVDQSDSNTGVAAARVVVWVMSYGICL